MTTDPKSAASGRTNDAFDEKGCIVSRPEDFSAAWPRLREISRHGYPRHRRLWNRLRWSLVGRGIRGF